MHCFWGIPANDKIAANQYVNWFWGIPANDKIVANQHLSGNMKTKFPKE